jgi:hypothetical protein
LWTAEKRQEIERNAILRVFDHTVLEAPEKMQKRIEELRGRRTLPAATEKRIQDETGIAPAVARWDRSLPFENKAPEWFPRGS